MFSKAFFASAIVVALSLQAHAHAGVSPALGVDKSQLARSDVQRPSTEKPCGNINITQTLDKSTAVNAGTDGSFTVTATDFNPGKDGSRQVAAQVDAAGDGKKFVPAKVTTNGDPAPAKSGSQKIVAQLPPNTKCTGGKSKNLCLVSFKTTAGFGNCVVVKQGGGGAAAKGGVNNASNGSQGSMNQPKGSMKGGMKNASNDAMNQPKGSMKGGMNNASNDSMNQARVGVKAVVNNAAVGGASNGEATKETAPLSVEASRPIVGTRAPRALRRANTVPPDS